MFSYELVNINAEFTRYKRQVIDSLLRKYRINYSVVWAGTQVAKGGRLSNGSVLLKGKMEK